MASTANAPSPKELATLPTGGKNEFQLIGVADFNLPAHRDHTVVVKGLPIKATPVSRLNVTSVTMSQSCPQVVPSSDADRCLIGGVDRINVDLTVDPVAVKP